MPIYKYTAKQAVEDGILCEVGNIAKEAGFVYQVRITSGVYELVSPSEEAKQYGQSYEGRLWDVLIMAHLAVKNSKDESLVTFKVLFQNGSTNQQTIELWAALDTTSGPAIHILLPTEY